MSKNQENYKLKITFKVSKIIIACLMLLGNLKSFSQAKYYKTQIALGFSKRSAMYYKGTGTNNSYYPFAYDVGGHLKKMKLSLDIKRPIYKDKIIIQLSNNIAFDLLKRGSSPYGNSFEDYGLRRDHFVDFIYTEPIKKKNTKILIGIGYGVMNAGTDFYYTKFVNGVPFALSVFGTLRLFAPRLTFGLERGVFNGFITANYTGRDELYNKIPAFNLDGKLMVTFPKFKKINWRRKK